MQTLKKLLLFLPLTFVLSANEDHDISLTTAREMMGKNPAKLVKYLVDKKIFTEDEVQEGKLTFIGAPIVQFGDKKIDITFSKEANNEFDEDGLLDISPHKDSKVEAITLNISAGYKGVLPFNIPATWNRREVIDYMVDVKGYKSEFSGSNDDFIFHSPADTDKVQTIRFYFDIQGTRLLNRVKLTAR